MIISTEDAAFTRQNERRPNLQICGRRWEINMNQFRRFLYGRYGYDRLTRDLVIVSMIFTLLSSFTGFTVLYILACFILLYAVYRTLSKNITKRSNENMVYQRMTAPLGKKSQDLFLTLLGTKTHKFYHCSRCRQTIRVPRGKGKICITCPKCRNEFIRRT